MTTCEYSGKCMFEAFRGFNVRVLGSDKGVSAVLMIIFILLMSLMGVTLVYVVVLDNRSSLNQFLSEQSHSASESGLELGLTYLIKKNCALPPCRCADISGAAEFTNRGLGQSVFTVTGAFYHSRILNPGLIPGVTSLAGNITADAFITDIDVADAAGYAPYGRVWLGSEAVDYTAINGNIFENSNRGSDITPLNAHAAGVSVIQNQCNLTSTGTRNKSARVNSVAVAMQDGWIVASGGDNLLLRYQDNEWVDYSSQAPGVKLNDVFILSSAEVWAVGKDKEVLRFDGKTWTAFPGAFDERLESVFMLDTNSDGLADSGWAVGKKGYITGYDGSVWNDLGCSPVNKDLLQVVITSATDGWILVKDKNKPFLRLSLSGCAWEKFSGGIPLSGGKKDIKALFFTSENSGWAVGKKGVIWRWAGGPNWIAHPSSEVPTNKELKGLFMLDTNGDGVADDGWALGKGSVIIRYNGATDTWAFFNAPVIDEDVNGIFMASTIEGWIVGKNGSIFYWNGREWTVDAPGAGIDGKLESVVVITPRHRVIDWREVY